MQDIFRHISIIGYELIIALVIILASLFTAQLAAYFIDKHNRRKTNEEKAKSSIATAVRVLLPLLGIWVALKYIRLALLGKGILDYEEEFNFLRDIIFIITSGLTGIAVYRIANFFMLGYIRRVKGGPDINLSSLFSKILKLVFFILVLIVVLDHFGININTFVVSLGVTSLAVALAAQETLANIIAGIVLLTDKPFKIGDVVQLPTGEVGKVSFIGIRSCRIFTTDDKELTIPNTELTKNRIFNYSIESRMYKATFQFSVSYKVDFQVLKDDIQNSIMSSEKFADTEPLVILSSMEAESYTVNISAKIDDNSKQLELTNLIKEFAYKSVYKQRQKEL